MGIGMQKASDTIIKHTLSNGLTVLLRPNTIIPKVSIQLWYNVGSKDEKSGERGIAHLIEHMIFKGTKKLSESDINMITHKLSGYCNAFTSYDYTGYLFDLPSGHWHEALPIMADCMRNCTFKSEFLASEMKAVIQELKMYRDDYFSSLIESMISRIFIDHPYHYPIIGFKQDLWSVTRDDLLAFYHKHYLPNNATLVVVGDIDADKSLAAIEANFSNIEPDFSYAKDTFYCSSDIASTQLALSRDIKQPILLLAWTIPGAHERKDYYIDVLSWVIGLGKSSRLYKLLVDEKQLAVDVEAFAYDLFDRGIFFVYIQPTDESTLDSIVDLVVQELSAMTTQGISLQEITRGMKQTQAHYLQLLESNQKQAYVIGQSYLATGDENFLFNYIRDDVQDVQQNVMHLLKHFLRPSLVHRGQVTSLAESDKEYWHTLQTISDQEDNKILSAVARTAPVEKGVHVHTVKPVEPKKFVYPRAKRTDLDNGLTLLTYANTNVPTIDIVISLQAKHYYDPEALQGLYSFMCAVMTEGTKQYSGQEFSYALESRGITLSIVPGQIAMSLLAQDFEYALHMLKELLINASFEEAAIEKVRSQLFADIKEYWDTPASFIAQLARDQVYRNHPYSKKVLGSPDSITKIHKEDLVKAYKRFITPQGATMAIVGDIKSYNVADMVQAVLREWQGGVEPLLHFPILKCTKPESISYPMKRDQIVLGYAGLSISRLDKDYDKILLFDQIFTGGVLGSMSSRLFQLREESGLFYTIGGSMLAYADEQPGMIFVKTIVSLDRLHEAERAIEYAIDHATEAIDDDELIEAQNALRNSLVDNFSSNKNIAQTLLFLHRFKLPDDYFDNRPQQLMRISRQEIIDAAHDLLQTSKLVKIRIGRL